MFLALVTQIVAEDCDCKQCEANNVIGLENNNGSEEDSNGDGNKTICARDRDYDDRSFPSICHMRCLNKCTSFGLQTFNTNNGKIQFFAIYRTSEYL